jgi:hypothetical protein
MLWLNLLVVILGCQRLGVLNQLLGFYGKFIKTHLSPPSVENTIIKIMV